jgi:hypothetical protein
MYLSQSLEKSLSAIGKSLLPHHLIAFSRSASVRILWQVAFAQLAEQKVMSLYPIIILSFN